MQQTKQLLTIKEASQWVSNLLRRDVSDSNISYLVQYGKVKKYNGGNSIFVDVDDLKNYYDSYRGQREIDWKKRLGNDLNWTLSFDNLREKDTTKHVHRLHPYKGKFIPQLVQYFIDNPTDDFKKAAYFKSGDIVLDPFSGSGTTLVQAHEMGIDAIGIDISHFNCMITETKLLDYDFPALENEVKKIRQAITNYEADIKLTDFENELLTRMADFNNNYFPSPEFKYKVQRGQIDEKNTQQKKKKSF
jgi:DNA modification methylase